jgi:hypothetical protein
MSPRTSHLINKESDYLININYTNSDVAMT